MAAQLNLAFDLFAVSSGWSSKSLPLKGIFEVRLSILCLSTLPTVPRYADSKRLAVVAFTLFIPVAALMSLL